MKIDRLTLAHRLMAGLVCDWPWRSTDTVRGMAEAVEREDGSGYSFNVRVRLWARGSHTAEERPTDRTVNVYVRCPD